MKNKLSALIGGTLLSVVILGGCGTDEQDPPPEDVNIETPGDNDDNINGDRNGINGNGADIDNGINNRNGTNDRNNGNGLRNGANDSNTNGEGDIIKDDNTPAEDIIEDGRDMMDNDNKDR